MLATSQAKLPLKVWSPIPSDERWKVQVNSDHSATTLAGAWNRNPASAASSIVVSL